MDLLANLGKGLALSMIVLGISLGPMLEENLRKALTLSRGDPSLFFTRPISVAMLGIAVMLRNLARLMGMSRTVL